MKMTACCGFGHRDVLEKIDDAVYAAVLMKREICGENWEGDSVYWL